MSVNQLFIINNIERRINLFYNLCRKSKTNLVQFIREWKITDCPVAHPFPRFSYSFFFFQLRLCPMYRFVHEKHPNRWESSDVKLQLMFISERTTRDGMPFPTEKHSCPDWVSRGYAHMYVSLHVWHRMCTHAKESGTSLATQSGCSR